MFRLILLLLISGALFANQSFSHLTYVGGKGRGYTSGYQTGGVSIFNSGDSCSLKFLELQMMRISPGRFGGNCGVGWRRTLHNLEDMLGFNFFYDYRRDGGVYFQQVGLGMEYFNPIFDFRMNSYLPIVRNRGIESVTTIEYEEEESQIITSYDAPYWGLDVEFASILKVGGIHSILVGVGPYFYDTTCSCYAADALLGGMFRLKAQVSNTFTAEFLMTYDHVFHFAPQGIFTWRKSFGGKGPPCGLSNIRVFRNPVIVTAGNHALYD